MDFAYVCKCIPERTVNFQSTKSNHELMLNHAPLAPSLCSEAGKQDSDRWSRAKGKNQVILYGCFIHSDLQQINIINSTNVLLISLWLCRWCVCCGYNKSRKRNGLLRNFSYVGRVCQRMWQKEMWRGGMWSKVQHELLVWPNCMHWQRPANNAVTPTTRQWALILNKNPRKPSYCTSLNLLYVCLSVCGATLISNSKCTKPISNTKRTKHE